MPISFGTVSSGNTFANATAVYENGFVKITAPSSAERINFYAPSGFNYADVYTLNGSQVQVSNLTNNQPIMSWVVGAPVSAIYDPDTDRLYLSTILSEGESLHSSVFANATAEATTGSGGGQ